MNTLHVLEDDITAGVDALAAEIVRELERLLECHARFDQYLRERVE